MDRFLKLKAISEMPCVEGEPKLKLNWHEDKRHIYYTEEYEGYPHEKLFWQVDKATGNSWYRGSGEYDHWVHYTA